MSLDIQWLKDTNFCILRPLDRASGQNPTALCLLEEAECLQGLRKGG
jgi:hypothetical protein